MSPPHYPSTTRRPAPLRTLSLEEGTLVEHREEHPNHLSHCSTANLAFYWEQMELAWQAQDLASKVYEEAKVDDNPEVYQFLQLCD